MPLYQERDLRWWSFLLLVGGRPTTETGMPLQSHFLLSSWLRIFFHLVRSFSFFSFFCFLQVKKWALQGKGRGTAQAFSATAIDHSLRDEPRPGCANGRRRYRSQPRLTVPGRASTRSDIDVREGQNACGFLCAAVSCCSLAPMARTIPCHTVETPLHSLIALLLKESFRSHTVPVEDSNTGVVCFHSLSGSVPAVYQI